ITWPGEKHGFAVVVGEERLPAIGSNRYHCYLLAETEEQNTEHLLNKCAELTGLFKVQQFYGRCHKPSMRYLDVWNRKARDRGLPKFYLYEAPSSDVGLIEYQINILLDRLSTGYKTLHLAESQFAEYLSEVPANCISTATDSQFPAVGALGYAVSSLTVYPPCMEEVEETDSWDGRDLVTGY
ncbi:hypothetical protein ACFL5K_05815, partial [Gemmatimonadota bacterium]